MEEMEFEIDPACFGNDPTPFTFLTGYKSISKSKGVVYYLYVNEDGVQEFSEQIIFNSVSNKKLIQQGRIATISYLMNMKEDSSINRMARKFKETADFKKLRNQYLIKSMICLSSAPLFAYSSQFDDKSLKTIIIAGSFIIASYGTKAFYNYLNSRYCYQTSYDELDAMFIDAGKKFFRKKSK